MALRVAHRGYVIQTGRIVLHDTAAELLRSALVRKTYLGRSSGLLAIRRSPVRSPIGLVA